MRHGWHGWQRVRAQSLPRWPVNGSGTPVLHAVVWRGVTWATHHVLHDLLMIFCMTHLHARPMCPCMCRRLACTHQDALFGAAVVAVYLDRQVVHIQVQHLLHRQALQGGRCCLRLIVVSLRWKEMR